MRIDDKNFLNAICESNTNWGWGVKDGSSVKGDEAV